MNFFMKYSGWGDVTRVWIPKTVKHPYWIVTREKRLPTPTFNYLPTFQDFIAACQHSANMKSKFLRNNFHMS